MVVPETGINRCYPFLTLCTKAFPNTSLDSRVGALSRVANTIITGGSK